MNAQHNGAWWALGGLGLLVLVDSGRRGSGNVRFSSVEDLERTNRGNGGRFFEPSVMQAFSSQIETQILPGNYFVTSERFPRVEGAAFPRRYTLRRATNNGAIQTIGGYQAFDSVQDALAAIPQPFGQDLP